MKRKLRLVLIALLEVVWIIISTGFFIIFLWGSIQSYGFLGILTGTFIGILAIAGVGGLVFLFIEIYYTLRSIEHYLDDLLESKEILMKMTRIEYRIYEMFYEQFYGSNTSDTAHDPTQVDSVANPSDSESSSQNSD